MIKKKRNKTFFGKATTKSENKQELINYDDRNYPTERDWDVRTFDNLSM